MPRRNDYLLDKAWNLADRLAKPSRLPSKDLPHLRRLIDMYVEARRVDDDAMAARCEVVLRQVVYGGVAALHAAAVEGLELKGVQK